MNFSIGISDIDTNSANTTPSANRSSATAKQWKIEHEAIVAERTRRILHGSTPRSTSGAVEAEHNSAADEEFRVWRDARSEGPDGSVASLDTPSTPDVEMSRDAMASVDIQAWCDEVQRVTAPGLAATSAQGGSEPKEEQSDSWTARESNEDAGSPGDQSTRNNKGSEAVNSGYGRSSGASSGWDDATGSEGDLGTTTTTTNSNDGGVNVSIESSTSSGPTTPLLKRAFLSCWDSLKSGIGLLTRLPAIELSDPRVVLEIEELHIGKGVEMPEVYGSDHGDGDFSQDGHNVWQDDDGASGINDNPTSNVWRSGSRLERGIHLA
jgi:hypothetical protein